MNKAWHLHDPKNELEMENLHNSVFAQCRAIESKQITISSRANLLMSAYTGRNDAYWEDWNISPVGEDMDDVPNLDYSENLIASKVDTVHSNIAKSRPKCTPVVRKAEFNIYRGARNLDTYLYGLFLEHAYTAHSESFLDCLVVPTGAVKVTQIDDGDDEKFLIERIHPDEIVVDQAQCISSAKPREVFHRRLVHRDVVMGWIEGMEDGAKKKKLIDKVSMAQRADTWSYIDERTPCDRDMLVVVEAYFANSAHRPGRRAVCIENCTLEFEHWKLDRAPFVWFRWKSPRKGFHGYPLSESTLPYQIRLNELNDTIKRGQDLYAIPRTWVPAGTSLLPLKLSNELGEIYQYQGDRPPVTTIWEGASREVYSERDREIRRAFEQDGVSQMQSQNTLPSNARLDSSKAIRELNLREDGRHAPQAIKYEESFLETAQLVIELASLSGRNSKSRVVRGKLVREVDWHSINLAREDYELTLETSSILNMTPAARKDEVNELIQSGLIGPDEAIYLIGNSDVDLILKRKNAAREAVESQLDQILAGEAVSPWPEMNLPLAINLATAEMNNLAQFPDTPTDIVLNLQAYISQAVFLSNPPASPIDPNAGMINGPAAAPIPGLDANLQLPPAAVPGITGQPII